MQEKINKRRFALLAVLTVVTLLVFWWIQPENRVDIDDNIFQVDDLTSISRVELSSRHDTVTLEFDGGRWRVNDQYDADAGMVRVLFATLQQARPKRAVAALRKDSTYQELEHSAVRVSLFEGGNLEKQFLAGGNTAKTQALFADPETGEVYVMTIPGYRVYVSGILELKTNGWRDKLVFGFNWRNFKSLEAEFPRKPSENFIVSRQKDQFGVNGIATDTARLNTFLDNVSLLTVDQYISEPGLSDSLRRTASQLEFRVTDIGNRTYSLKLFENTSSHDVTGLIQDADPAIFSNRKIQPLLKGKSFFRKK
ncbi:MAG: DUF4340 domain-containing protein [Bacteroidota bacterium]|nr:DUF4340 domain-containing protein [Bacteroidota bacterium]